MINIYIFDLVCVRVITRARMYDKYLFWNLKGAGICDNEQDMFLPQNGKIYYQKASSIDIFKS